MLSFVLPTRDRPAELERTLAALGALEARDDAEVIIVDNASHDPVAVPGRLANGWRALTLRLRRNLGAAARNEGARLASGRWLVMLDDDSHPIDLGVVDAIAEAAPDVAAIGAEIRLKSGGHDAGGLPEVIVGCGAAIRRDAFLATGGYDVSFHFYVEEYDLCAKLILAGHRIVHDTRFKVMHEKTLTGRDMNTVLGRLVRNNAWVIERYAPDNEREAALRETIDRYSAIAERECARVGFGAGVAEMQATLGAQRRTPMNALQWQRFTGRVAAKSGLERARELIRAKTVALVAPGKGSTLIKELVHEIGGVEASLDDASALVIATLSPGPILDALNMYGCDGRRVIAPWMLRGADAKLRRAG